MDHTKNRSELLNRINQVLISQLEQEVESLVTPERRRRIVEVLRERTRNIIPVLENIYDSGNINAVLRSAEGLGYQESHIIESTQTFSYSKRVTRGAHRWLDTRRWSDTTECIRYLKTRGYRIIATQLTDSVPIHSIDFTIPTVICFGNEAEGVSEALSEMADARCHIPMVGFSESFNISVAAALALQHIRTDRIHRQGFHGDLGWQDKKQLRHRFHLQSCPLRGRDLYGRHTFEGRAKERNQSRSMPSD